jgi:tetratricopeptide (TPR) repeat protein
MSSYPPRPPQRPGPARPGQAPPRPPQYAQQYGRPAHIQQDADARGGVSVPRPLVVGAIIVGVVLSVALAIGLRSGKRSSRQSETIEDKYKDASEAYSTSVGTQAEETAAIKASLDIYTKAIAAEDWTKAADCFDTERMLREVQALGMLTNLNRRDEAGFATGVRRGLANSLSQPGNGLAVASVDVKLVKPLPDKTEAVVYLRAHHPLIGKLKYRWWVKKRGSQWRIYDIEDLDGGLRVSNTMAAAVGSGPAGSVAPWVGEAKNLQGAYQALASNDLESAEEAVKKLESAGFPPPIQAQVIAIKGIIANRQEKPDEALKLFDQAQALHGDLPALNYQRAVAYNLKGEPDKALALARKYLDLLGDDADVWYIAGEALEALDREDEALEAYRKGHDDEPANVDNLTAIARILPPEKAKELTDRFSRTLKQTLDRGETFASVATEIEDGKVLEALVAAYRKEGGKGYGADYHDARAKLMLDQHEQAYLVLKRLVAKAPEDEKEEVEDMLLHAAAGSGKWQELYESKPDPAKAFRSVGYVLAGQDKAKELRTLVDLHRKKLADDPQIQFFLGKALMIEKDYAKAGDQFAAALKAAKDENQRLSFGHDLVVARHSAGKGLAAYAEAPAQDKVAVFKSLSDLMVADKDAENLAKLIQTHGQTIGITPALTWAQARLHWIKGEYAPMADVLISSRETLLKDDPTRTYPMRDMLVRGLVRLKRIADARRELKKFGDTPVPLYPAVIEVCSLDPAAAGKAVAEYVAATSQGAGLATLYQDPDAGPAMRSADLFSLRIKYPEPTTKPTTAPAGGAAKARA